MKRLAEGLKLILRCLYRALIRDMPTVISRDCIGGVLYKRMGAQFTSPTINLYMTNEDFLLFCANLELFLLKSLEQEKSDRAYPVGLIRSDLGDVHLYFIHYLSFEEAKACWERRKARVNYSNIILIMNAENDANEAVIQRFNCLPYKKILLTSNAKRNHNVVNLRCYQNGYRGPLVAYRSKRLPVLRYMDEVNWIYFLNSNQ